MNIALIDDDLTTNFIHKTKILKKFPNANIVLFNNGKEALDSLIDGNVFDYAILDLNMPVMNGLEFLTEHVNLNTQQKIKKIVLFIEQKIDQQFIDENELFLHLQKPLNNEKVDRIFNG